MSKIWIETILYDVKNGMRINRNKAATTVIENPAILNDLVELVFEVNNKQSIKAAWVLEWICNHKNLDLILPYVDIFTENIGKLHFNSAIRPCAKICELLSVAYTSKKNNLVKQTLTPTHLNLIIETGFDWLITPQKIAVRAYTMTTLYNFGLEKEWVHPELLYLINTKIIHESKGCKARGKHVIHLIEKHQKSRL